MSKATELKTTTILVRDILEKHPEARNSDDVLYYLVCSRINPEALEKPFWAVFVNRKAFNFPAFETVRRTRQKMQQCFPELAGSYAVEVGRIENEEAFRKYARQVNV